MTTTIQTPHVIHQQIYQVERRPRGGRGKRSLSHWAQGGQGNRAQRRLQGRQRVTHAVGQTFNQDAVGLRNHRSFRPDAYLSPEQIWEIYSLCGEVRSAVDGIVRRVSTWDRRVVPLADPATDDQAYRDGLRQARFVERKLKKPSSEDDWRTFWTKVSTDALVFWHGSFERAYSRAIDVSRPEIEYSRGNVQEFVPVYGPSIHPQVDSHGRLLSYVQQLSLSGQVGTITLDRDQISRLVLAPNTRSPYMVPIIETIAREATTIVRASERAMATMDHHEVPTGFLILTGMDEDAADNISESARHNAGDDSTFRVIHSMGSGSPAQWLQIQETLKEVEFAEVLREVRKAIWRAFGVTPIEQGDTEGSNRANSQVQLEVGNSHLVEPLLEAISLIVNGEMIPDLVGGEDQVLCRFEFIADESLTPEEEKTLAEAAAIRLSSGQTSVNEERAERGLPRIDGGDEHRVNGVLVGSGEEDGTANTEDIEASEEAAAADERVAALLQEWRGEIGALLAARRREDRLPSEWEDGGVFEGAPTLDLSALAAEISGYRRDIEPLWVDLTQALIVRTTAFWRSGNVGSVNHLRRIADAFEEFELRWSMASRKRYIEAAELGARSAREVSGNDTLGENARARGLAYHDQAMVYLRDLIADTEGRVISNIEALRERRPIVREIGDVNADTGQVSTDDDESDEDSDLEDLIEAIELAVAANEFRTDNWSGRLIEEATQSFVEELLTDTGEEATPGVDGAFASVDPPEEGADEWWFQWRKVGDARTCPTCEREGSGEFRRLRSMTVTPGGATECRARCRCVIVVWKAEEIISGKAKIL